MLAHGFTNAMLDALVRDGLATAGRKDDNLNPITTRTYSLLEVTRNKIIFGTFDHRAFVRLSMTKRIRR
jgi:hypothetical protein